MSPNSEQNGYRDLTVWQKGRELTETLYELVERLPRTERWVWELQLKRAAAGITGNIAEGYGTGTLGNFRRHVRIARGSASEVESHLLSMRATDVGPEQLLDDNIERAGRTLRLLNGFEAYLTRELQDAA